MRGLDMKKDQSFFLCHLKDSLLPFVQFPIGGMMKSDVKRLANEMNLQRISQKAESKCILSDRFK